MVKRWRGPETLTMIGEANDSNIIMDTSTLRPAPFLSVGLHEKAARLSLGAQKVTVFSDV